MATLYVAVKLNHELQGSLHKRVDLGAEAVLVPFHLTPSLPVRMLGPHPGVPGQAAGEDLLLPGLLEAFVQNSPSPTTGTNCFSCKCL